jgi:hypothetical protein
LAKNISTKIMAKYIGKIYWQKDIGKKILACREHLGRWCTPLVLTTKNHPFGRSGECSASNGASNGGGGGSLV